MPTALLCPFWTLALFYMSTPVCLSYWISIQDPLSHSVLLCEQCTSYFSSRTERILWQFSTSCFDTLLWYVLFFFKEFWLLIAFAFLRLWHGITYIWYTVYSASFLWVFFYHPLGYLRCENGWGLKIVFQTSFTFELFTGVK